MLLLLSYLLCKSWFCKFYTVAYVLIPYDLGTEPTSGVAVTFPPTGAIRAVDK